MKIKNKVFLISIFVLFFYMISSVCAVTYTVNESWTSQDIQDLINDDSNDLTGLHFNGTNSSVYEGIILIINRAIDLTCDVGVVLNDLSEGCAFIVLNDNVKIQVL